MTAGKIKLCVCAAVCTFLCMLCCGYRKQELQVVIRDGNVRTQMTANAGDTVEEILARAELSVGERDIISPAKDTVLDEGDQEIVISRYAKVSVAYGGEEQEVELTGATVRDAFDALDIELHPKDYVNHSPEAYLEDGMELFAVHRSEVTLVADGETFVCVTTAYCVDDFLAERGLSPGQKDRVSPAGETPLCDGMEIVLERVSVETITEREPIAFETRIEYSGSLYIGESVEKTAGVDGEKEITYEIVSVDGKPGKKTAVSEKVVKEPVDQVIVQGTKEKVQPQKPKPDQNAGREQEGRSVVSKQKVPDCDGSGHGYYVITWSDGTVEYEDY